ncbi:hypothetical protein HXX76_011543 [Chlamydomonas incerta]|uniref:phytol kinase n=1 Tax=Chlamydomonas incerta TaxID=51695 RepID=A0A835SJS5_CHLIN|nr:hypothetical protein HXX76_011543 [Chlamydomonas incerta]|eukprot:KAG2428423.1 hypothetical protein HXX76_011543 [Chlamydomonas incerta]
MRRSRAGAGAAARQKSTVERDLSAALAALIAGQGLQRHVVERLASSHDEMHRFEQSPESNAAALAVLGWAAREAASLAEAQQQQPRPGPSVAASDEELVRLLQLVSAALAPLTVLAEAKSHNVKLGRAVVRSQLPQALVRLLAALCPPGFRCCGSAGGGGQPGSAGLKARLDVVVGVAILSAGLWRAQQRTPDLAACLTDSHLVESVAVALLRAQAAECGQQQPWQQHSGGAGAGRSTTPAGSGGSGRSCYEAWLRGGRTAPLFWPALRGMLTNLVTVAAPAMPPRDWHVTPLLKREASTLPHCRAALAGPAIQLLLGRVLVAETNRCPAEAEAEAAEEAAAGAGGSRAESSRAGAGAAAGVHKLRWRALPECLRSGTLPLPRHRSSAADLLMEVVECAGAVWSFTVSGPRLPRLGQPPAKAIFGRHSAAEAMCKVMGGVAAPEEEAAVAAAEAQLPPLHPPSYTAVQVYELTHAALTAALAHAPAEAVSYSAPSLLARLVMELPPRQAVARLPGLWRTLSSALPRLACSGADDGTTLQGRYWKCLGLCRSVASGSLLSYLGLLLQLQLPPGPAAAAQPPAAAASPAAAAAGAAAPSGAAAPGPEPDFSLRCALRGGLLPAIEALLRRLLGRTAAVALAGPQQAAGFMDAALQTASTIDILLRTSGVWPAVLAHGPPQQVVSLVRTMGKVLAVVGDTFHALRQRPQLLEPATQMLSAMSDNNAGQGELFDALAALLEQARCMTDGVLTVQRLQLTRAELGRAGGWPDRFRHLPINDSLDPDEFTLHTDWSARVGGCPPADTAAAHQQRVLADWAVLQWMPGIMGQTERDDPTLVCHSYSINLLLAMACRALWPELRERPITSDAAAAVASWKRFLLHDLDALGWTERVLARTVASTEPEEGDWLSWGLLGVAVLSVSQMGAWPEACEAAAGSTSAAAASVPLQAGAAAVCNSDTRRQQQQEQHQKLFQHVRRIAYSMDAEQVEALLGGAGLALCGNPACRSLEGNSEAGLMATQAPQAPAGRQQGGLGGGGGGGGGGRIKICTRCRAVRYCCGACQLQHWTTGGHKEACEGAAGVSGSAGGGQTAGR